MLTGLSIRDLVSIERLDIEAGRGLTVLTGETGAGKSILLDALGWVLGRTPERRMVRTGREQANVMAEFSLRPDHPAFDALEEAGLPANRSEALTLRRVVRAQGAARALINDQAVSSSLLARVGALLVEIHAQHESLALLRPAAQRGLLDQYGGHDDVIARVVQDWADLQAARAECARMERESAAGAAEREALQERLALLEEVQPSGGEAEALAVERQNLAALARLESGLHAAASCVQKGEGGLGEAARELARAVRLIPAADEGGAAVQAELARVADAIERAMIEAQEAAGGLQSLVAALAHATPRLETIETRLSTLRALARRCQCAPEALAGEADALRTRLDRLEGIGDACAGARARLAAAEASYGASSRALSAARAQAARALEAAVMVELPPLRLAHARFAVSLSPAEPGPSGCDTVGFTVATAPGAEPGPIEDVASGGELSRFALALRVALADAGPAGVLIFDEIDQGAGGAVAAAIGERLARLARVRQVLVVTHSPQVAACADAHWRFSKGFTEEGLGLTRLGVLDAQARQDELARMLAGHEVTPEARAAAGRLLDRDPQARPDARRRPQPLAKAG